MNGAFSHGAEDTRRDHQQVKHLHTQPTHGHEHCCYHSAIWTLGAIDDWITYHQGENVGGGEACKRAEAREDQGRGESPNGRVSTTNHVRDSMRLRGQVDKPASESCTTSIHYVLKNIQCMINVHNPQSFN